jgi:phosphohistidine phosphatase
MPKRELILIRHTKSSWTDFNVSDFEHPIKEDRIDDAINMAARLKKMDVKPDLIICSPAKRTQQTANYFCEKLKYKVEQMQLDKRIYESSPEDILQVVQEIGAENKTVLLIGHNPSITYFANWFMDEKIDQMPTTGVVWLEFKSETWQIDRQTPCRLIAFLTPRTIENEVGR